MADLTACPRVPVAWGELLDKIAILELKAERIRDPQALRNVGRELAALRAISGDAPMAGRAPALVARLKAVNAELWEIEDDIRLCEAAGEFGQRFVALARSVYKTNDLRAVLKRELNDLLGSELVEEKSYAGLPQVCADA